MRIGGTIVVRCLERGGANKGQTGQPHVRSERDAYATTSILITVLVTPSMKVMHDS